jgi:AbiJ N-terminal domain 4
MKFSQRIGKTQLIKEIQLESIDDDLKNGLWNIYHLFILEIIEKKDTNMRQKNPVNSFSYSLWHDYFKRPIDTMPEHFFQVCNIIRHYFFSCEWHQLYDLIEFTIDLSCKKFRLVIDKTELFEGFNSVLEREFAGYRFIEGHLSPITNSTEIEEIQQSLSETDSFTLLKGCNTHLKSALSKLSDRTNPDYRNSIKESISAVESIAKVLSQNQKDSLAGAIDKIKGKLKIHAALERGFKQIYGYTSDTDGIRHALTEEANCDFEDAKFMIVSCSAFINYLIAKAHKAGFTLT